MKKSKGEKVIIVTTILTAIVLIVVLAISKMLTRLDKENYVPQKNTTSEKIKNKDSDEVDTEKEYIVSKEDYEIVKNENINKKFIYTIFTKTDFNLKEIADVVSQLKEDNKDIKDNYEVYLFTDKNRALNFKYNSNKKNIDKLVLPKGSSNIQVAQYYNISSEIKSSATNYGVLSVMELEDYTKIEMILRNVSNEKEALAQIKNLGEKIRNLNNAKNKWVLKIIAYSDESKQDNWEYDGNYKSRIIKNEYQQLK